ncbi:MAG TPA: helix-turn-helix domain-containing protein [Capillimicrobium sp.]
MKTLPCSEVDVIGELRRTSARPSCRVRTIRGASGTSAKQAAGPPLDAPGPQIADAAQRLAGRLDDVTRAMVARILDEVPIYRRLPPDGLANVERLASRNSRILTEALRTGGRLDRDDVRYVAEHARERVRRGVSLEEMLHAYRVGLTAFWEECMSEAIALGFSRDAALGLARRTSELSDDLTTHAAETYVREESRLRAVSDQQARDVLELLLRGDADADTLKSHRVAPGLDAAERLVVVLARVSSTAASPSDALDLASQPIARALSTGRASPLVAIRGGAVVAIAPLDDGAAVAQRLTALQGELRDQGTECFFGLSMPRASLAAVPVGFDQAALAVSRASAEQPVVSLSELPLLQNLLLGATSTMRTVLETRAQELHLDDPEALPAIRETLQALADADMNLTHAADALHVHPNTLRYRLRRIRERTGRDPRSFADLVDLICLVSVVSAEP